MRMGRCSHQIEAAQLITEHTGLTHEPDTIHNTRTIRTWPILRWMAWNMQYHTAHHTFPGVPFYNLAALHRELRPIFDRHRMRRRTYGGLLWDWFVRNKTPHIEWH